ncbi:hypothetical protein HMN09_00012400 [Mycena chlorophos]|uniref:Cytochrome P450 n=1 Tax=Mycena chlorophos TaxID=658473 RepID=A0A8H6TT80_MYCCL|nr:hypothetical protein HMN09_00012400 [Mycena chlorophos]
MSTNLKDLIGPAIVLGVLNHVYFHRFEPVSAGGPLVALAVQPLLLVAAIDLASLTPASVGLVTLAFLASLSFSIVAYRLSPWHPLANVPGPLLPRITKWWGVWLTYSGKQHRVIKALHDRYGECVRTGPNEVSIIRLEAVKEVLGANGLQKGQYYEPRVDPNLKIRNLLTATGDDHTHRRRAWLRGMSPESLKEFEVLVARRVEQLLARLDGLAVQGPVNIAAWFGYFAFDFMGDMAFGGGFEMIRDGGDKQGYWTLLRRSNLIIAALSHIPWLSPTIYRLPFVTESSKKLRAFGSQIAANRIRDGPKLTKDLWYHLMDEDGHEKERPSMKNVVAEGILAIVAGSDTTSVALSSLFWCLLSHPAVYARVQAEVDTVYPDAERILDDCSKHSELVFLTACLNEALRLFPPLPTSGARQVPTGESRLIAGRWVVPERTQVYVPPYALQRSAEYFSPAPNAFDPDRWLRTANSETQTGTIQIHTPAALIPFSYGPANCVGRPLAWREMLMVASALLKRYDMCFASTPGSAGGVKEGEKYPDLLEDAFITNVRGRLMVDMKLR